MGLSHILALRTREPYLLARLCLAVVVDECNRWNSVDLDPPEALEFRRKEENLAEEASTKRALIMDKGATIQRMFSVARVRFSVICTKHKTLSLSPLCLHLQPESVSKFKIHYQTLSLSVVLFPLFTKRKKKKNFWLSFPST